ncbi:uncharacterized protein LOC144436547 [Glandiceps talaboti]
MTERCLAALDYVDLQCKQIHRKHTKNRSLGDLESKYRYCPPRSASTIISTLVDLDFPETRAINDISATSIITEQRRHIQDTYKRATRTVNSAPSSRTRTVISPRSATLDRRTCTPEPSRSRVLSATRIRPFTAVEAKVSKHNRMSSANNRSKLPRSKSADTDTGRYMMVKMKRDGSSRSTSFRDVTRSIHDQWDSEDKALKKGVKKGRKVGTFDPNTAQWYTFTGGSPAKPDAGVVNAFAGKEIFYKIEGSVGDKVAQQIRNGSKIRIGVNGSIQTENGNLQAEDDSGEQEVHSKRAATAPVQEYVPLCWQDQVAKPTARVMAPLIPTPKPPKPDLSERHPVIFEKLIKDEDVKPRTDLRPDSYRVRQRVKNKLNIDGTASLNSRITVVTVDKYEDDQESLSSTDYNEILSEKLYADTIPTPEPEPTPIVEEKPKSGKKERKLQEDGLRSLSRESFNSAGTLEKPITPQASIVSGTVTDATFITTGVNPYKPHKGSTSVHRVSSGTSSVKINIEKAPAKTVSVKGHGLAKPGQLHRTGVPSISSPGRHDADQTSFIQIAQAISIPDTPSVHDLSSPMRSNTDINISSAQHNAKALSTVIDSNKVPDNVLPRSKHERDMKAGDAINLRGKQMQVIRSDGSGDNESRRSSAASSTGSMHVHKGTNGHGPGHVCTCTPEAKRAMAEFISHQPPPPTPITPPGSVRDADIRHYINIPTAPMIAGESDIHSVSDLDMHPVPIPIDERGVTPLDARAVTPGSEQLGTSQSGSYVTLENLAQANLKIEDHLQYAAEDTQQAESVSLDSETDHAVSHILEANLPTVAPSQTLDSVDNETNMSPIYDGLISEPEHEHVHKSVRFADENLSDVSANTASLLKSVRKDDNMIEVTLSKNPSGELSELRSKIKSDLQQTQENTQQDIQNLYMKQHAT